MFITYNGRGVNDPSLVPLLLLLPLPECRFNATRRMISSETYVRPWPRCAESYTVGPQTYHAVPRVLLLDDEVWVGDVRGMDS